MRTAPRTSDVVITLLGRELRASSKSALAWLAPTAGLVALTASMQPQMAQKGSIFEAKLAAMPKAMLDAMNMHSLDMSPVGFLAMNGATWMLLGALFAALLGTSLVAKEETWRTAEVLLTLPVRREAVVVGKALAGLALVVVFDVVLAASAWATYAGKGITVDDPARFFAMFAGAALVHLCVFALALVASVALTKARAALPLGLGLVFGTWGIGVVSVAGDALEPLRWLSPFKYADVAAVARAGLGGEAALLPIATVAAIVAAVVLYTRKDIHA